jgi:hypothetical protein
VIRTRPFEALDHADDRALPHVCVGGGTYTELSTGEGTALHYTIDMHVPTGGGPPPPRQHFEEMFTVLEGVKWKSPSADA